MVELVKGLGVIGMIPATVWLITLVVVNAFPGKPAVVAYSKPSKECLEGFTFLRTSKALVQVLGSDGKPMKCE